MRKREIDRFRKLLEEKKANLLERFSRSASEGRSSVPEGGEDYVDDAVTNYTREFMLSLSSMEQRQLAMIEGALQRIEDKVYGECAECGENVSLVRLKAVPWAALCVQCQEKAESEGATGSSIR